MDADYVIDLLRQFADSLEHPDLARNPLGEIEDLDDNAVPNARRSPQPRGRPSPTNGHLRPRVPPFAGRRTIRPRSGDSLSRTDCQIPIPW